MFLPCINSLNFVSFLRTLFVRCASIKCDHICKSLWMYYLLSMPAHFFKLNGPCHGEGGLMQFNPFQNKPWFLCVCSTRLLETLWEKEKSLITRLENSLPFSSNLKCRLLTFSVWKHLKFVFWERVNDA